MNINLLKIFYYAAKFGSDQRRGGGPVRHAARGDQRAFNACTNSTGSSS